MEANRQLLVLVLSLIGCSVYRISLLKITGKPPFKLVTNRALHIAANNLNSVPFIHHRCLAPLPPFPNRDQITNSTALLIEFSESPILGIPAPVTVSGPIASQAPSSCAERSQRSEAGKVHSVGFR